MINTKLTKARTIVAAFYVEHGKVFWFKSCNTRGQRLFGCLPDTPEQTKHNVLAMRLYEDCLTGMQSVRIETNGTDQQISDAYLDGGMNVQFGLFYREQPIPGTQRADNDRHHLRDTCANIARRDKDALIEITERNLRAGLQSVIKLLQLPDVIFI
ncbi:MAG: hypothetical protein JWN43_1027 [Gammaproteobacteria bacterium]|nr:hypothetical protein [Gammaproteobacteria bacterium]